MKSIIVSADHVNVVLAFCKEVLAEEGFSDVQINYGAQVVLAETGMSWRSLFGESIIVEVLQVNSGDFRIVIDSESTSALQVVDWGANSKNVNNILRAIQKKIKR